MRNRRGLQWFALIVSGGLFWAVIYMYAKSGQPWMVEIARKYGTMTFVLMLVVGVMALIRGGPEPEEDTGRLKVRGIDKSTNEETVVYFNTRSEQEARLEAESQGVIVLSVSQA